jgi:SAM-dependent methyltransferase
VSLALRRFWRLPAVQALLLQCAAFVPMLAVVYLLARNHYPLDNISVALLQGVIAAALCWWRGLATWWRLISFAFAPALYIGLSFELPSTPFLAAFLLMLLLYWSTFRTQVPYYPSGARIWQAVDGLLSREKPLRIIDIGSGLGGFSLDLARRRPDCEVHGIELAPLPWLVSRIRAGVVGSRARFVRGDYERLNFADYDVVFAYLSPAAMEQLWDKASHEMGKGAMLMSLEFTIPGHPPDVTVAAQGRDPALYVWHF